MKRIAVFGIFFVVALGATSLFAAGFPVAHDAGFSMISMKSVKLMAMDRDIEHDEAEFEPNDWSDPAVFPPVEWAGDIGVLPYDSSVIHGALDSTGQTPEGWYSGDTDLYGFNLPALGVLKLHIYFSNECDLETGFYTFMWLVEGSLGTLWILYANYNLDPFQPVELECPVELLAFMEPGFIVDPDTGETAEYHYLLIGGLAGDAVDYDLTLTFLDCSDDVDGDGIPDEDCGGWDCDDTDPLVNPDIVEGRIAGNCDDEKDNDCDTLIDEEDDGCQGCFVMAL